MEGDVTIMTRDASWGEPRSKTVTWFDPEVGLAAMASMDGLSYMQAMANGSIPPPPISGLVGFAPALVERGTVAFTCSPDESVYNPIGMVHGGLVCTLLDSVLGCAVQTTLPQGTGYTSLEIKVSYLRPVRGGECVLTATGRVTKPGRRAAFADGEVRDEQGRLVATGSSTLLVFPL